MRPGPKSLYVMTWLVVDLRVNIVAVTFCMRVKQRLVTCEASVQGQRRISMCAHAAPSAQNAADHAAHLKTMKILEGAVDDPHLGNPLERMHRLGTGWFGVIFEFEGVLVESAHEDHIKAWKEVCAREGKPNPPHWQLQRVEGMKNEQVGHCANYASTGML